MRNIEKKSKKNLLWIIPLLVLIVVGVYFVNDYNNNRTPEVPNYIQFKQGMYYRMFPWDTYQNESDVQYSYKELLPQVEKYQYKEPQKEKKPNEIEDQNENNGTEYKKTVKKPWAQIFASLSSASGALGVSGKARNAVFQIGDSTMGNSFSTGTGTSFTVKVLSATNSRTVSITSPAFATNATLQSLSIGVDPYSMYMTLSGSVKLDLPGDIMGTIYNTSNGTSGSATLQNGSFSVSVPLQMGQNNITASGKWMTIELQFPGISVNISQ